MALPSLSLKGKTAIVTGGRRGIGKFIALLFAEAGADVTLADIVSDAELETTTKEIQQLGRRGLAVQVDTTRKTDVDNMVQTAVKELGGVDILINAAGISTRTTPMEICEKEWDRVMDIDLKGCLLCAQAAGKQMIDQGRGGSIINLTSVAGIKAVAMRAGYASAKIGLIMLTRQLALELAPHNIRANAIAPGLVLTELTRDMWGDPELKKQMDAMVPLGSWAEPIDIANAALFLASDAAGYITGITLPVDGGASIG
jgi:NAD(P)-dependent dehydrogenase (short-subunit alcohol dehydrogenase family)